MKQLLLVFLGGGAGSALRYLISKYLNPVHMGIPYGTLAVNILGSLLVGLVIGLALKTNPISQNTMLLLATGFCGGFTTFSAFAYENQVFLRSGDFTSFAFYTLGTLVLGLAAVFFGIWMVRYF
jgi:CrcB protein